MKKMISVAVMMLPGCVTAQVYQQQAQPTMSEIQGQCMASYKKFLEQSSCIEKSVAGLPLLNPYAQEYVASLQSLSAKVGAGTLSGDDARFNLTKELNRLKSVQDSAVEQQQILDNAVAMQQYEMLKQNSPKLEVYRPSRPLNTNCRVFANQMNCTSY